MVAGLHDDRALASVRRNRQHSTQFAAAAGRAPIGSVVSAGCSWRWRSLGRLVLTAKDLGSFTGIWDQPS
jgi:hypothetical protein